ncbi:hypothetical protein [Mycolicibacterium fallax]|uniref:Uncharacterized protein n=1 Tax=Mycolicibacterium fallax TaxID=1793 RepID=A0A1X1RGX0_MYCFA|nr:hypothetical protein [Mycolicibacterium fallax]ORV05599.1 hypothetical protein AWC04_06705 [Mycolicibacterium fallax]
MNTLTLQDVADLAGVQRPVVSMWRRRPTVRGVSMPFPEPCETAGGISMFARDEIVDWLERTGRGNNAEVVADAPALAVPEGAELEDIVTLLVWHVLTGEDLAGTSHAYRVKRGAAVDPEDAVLLHELTQLRVPDAVLDYVDALLGASFGPSDALARLERGRLTRRRGDRDLTPEAIELLAQVVGAAAVHQGPDSVTLRVQGGAAALEVASIDGVSVTTADRSLVRRALLCDIPLSDRHGTATVSFLSTIGLAPGEVLDRADDAVLELPPGHIAVVLGPAEALTDALAGPLQNRRAEVLRVRNVVAALRMPRGLWREAHRQSLALWVCLGGANEDRPWVGDLAGEPALAPGDVAADVAAALAQTEERSFRYLRRIDLSTIVAGRTVVPRGVRATTMRLLDTDTHVDHVHRATLVTSAPVPVLDVLVSAAPGHVRLVQHSLAELVDAKRLVVKRGTRINPDHHSAEGSVEVLQPGRDRLRLDPIDAERHYPRSTRTQPGDVVICERPEPWAWVDRTGGAMVASPALILRPAPAAGLGPRLLAEAINTRGRGTEWRSWTVPNVEPAEATRLEAVLEDLDHYRDELCERLEAAGELANALIDGVSAGALTLDAGDAGAATRRNPDATA